MAGGTQDSTTGSFSRIWLVVLGVLGGTYLSQQASPPPAHQVATDAHADPEDGSDPAFDRQIMLRPLRGFLGLPDKPGPEKVDLDSKTKTAAGGGTEEDWRLPTFDDELLKAIHEQVGRLEFLVVTIADPVETKVNYGFDLQVDALQKVLAAEGYVFDRDCLPWPDKSKRNRFRFEPGVLLFRKLATSSTSAAAGKTDLLQVYLVGETLTSGIQQLAFQNALRQIVDLTKKAEHRGKGVGKLARKINIAGPTFSGGADSLARGLRTFHQTHSDYKFEIITGCATAVAPHAFRELAGSADGRFLSFHSTVHNSGLLRQALIEHIRQRSPTESLKIAWLTESGTTFGALASPQRNALSRHRPRQDTPKNQSKRLEDTIYEFRFPASISRVRADRERQRDTVAAPSKNNLAPTTYRVPIPYEDLETAHDFPETMTPSMTAPSAELVLGQILATIRNQGIEYVGISATDVRDPVFLAEMIRQQSPDVQILLVTADLLYLHPQYRSTLHGALVASTYSLFPEDQEWCFPYSGRNKRIFASQVQYGFYNAVAFLRGLSDGTYTWCNGSTVNAHNLAKSDGHLPISYGPPMVPRVIGQPAEFEPSVWISMIGPTAIWPVDCVAAEKIQQPTPEENESPNRAAADSDLMLQPPDYLIRINCPEPTDKDLTWKPSYDARIAPSAWIVIDFWVLLGFLLVLAALGIKVASWSEPLNFKIPFAPPDEPRLEAVRHVFRALALLAVGTPVACFAGLIAIPYVIRRTELASVAAILAGGVLILAALVTAALGALIMIDLFAALRIGLPKNGGRQPRVGLTPAFWILGGAILVGECLLATRLHDLRPSAAVLLYSVCTDVWNGVSMMLPVQLACGAAVILSYGMLHQCYSLRDLHPIPRPAWPPSSGLPAANEDQIATVRQQLLFPVMRRLLKLKSNWLYLGLPIAMIVWLVWLYCETANTQILPLRIDLCCLAYIIVCALWCVRFTKTFEICRQLAGDLEDFTRIFPDPLATWPAILKRLGTAETGGLPLLWSRREPARLEGFERARQRLLLAEKAQEPNALQTTREEFYAIHVEAYTRQIFRLAYHLYLGLMLSACLLLLTALSFPFNTEPLFQLTTAGMLFAASLVIGVYYIRFDQQRLVSMLVGTDPGRATWNWDMVHTLAPPLALGLVAILGQAFPEIWDWFGSLFDPLSRSTG